MKKIGVTLVLLLAACATPMPVYDQYDLLHQILTPRKGYEGRLVNRACSRRGDNGNCDKWSVKEYDLKDSNVRNILIKNDFDCVIGCKLYQICEHVAGLCHQEFKKTGCFLGFIGCKKEIKTDIISIDKYQYLIDSGTECASGKIYDVLNFCGQK